MAADYATIGHAAQAVAFSYIKSLVGAPEETQQLLVLLIEIEHQCPCRGGAQQVKRKRAQGKHLCDVEEVMRWRSNHPP